MDTNCWEDSFTNSFEMEILNNREIMQHANEILVHVTLLGGINQNITF